MSNSSALGPQAPFDFDFADNYGFSTAASVACGLLLFIAAFPLGFFVSTSPVHRWTRLALIFYCLFQALSFFMRALSASSARTNGSVFAAAQSTDIAAFYILVALVFNQDRRPKKYGDNRHAQLKQVIRWGGNFLLFLVMILGFAGALVGGGNWVQRADQMMQSSAVFMAVCVFTVVCLVLRSIFAPRFDSSAARVKEIDADLKASLVLLLISMALFIVAGYRVGAAFVSSIRVDHYYFSINFLLELGSVILLALSITAGYGGLEAKDKVNEAHGLMGRPAISNSNGIPFSTFAEPSSQSPAAKSDLARARSYNGPTARPGANVPVSATSKQVNIPLAGSSSVHKPPAQMNAQYNIPSNNNNYPLPTRPNQPPPILSSTNWPNPVDATPVVSNDPVIIPAAPVVPSLPLRSPINANNVLNSNGSRH